MVEVSSGTKVVLEDFNYALPKEAISQHLTKPRDQCKLLVVRKEFEHKKFCDLTEYVRKGDVIVINNTKVSHVKLVGRKTTGAFIEVLLSRKLSEITWECRVKGSNLRIGTELIFSACKARIVERNGDLFILEFDVPPTKGTLPTPPYIQAPIPESDYQTMFAQPEGSLAAPTAGLHFTPELVCRLEKKGVRFAQVTLHIGAGTFMPVKDPDKTHTEPEWYEILPESATLINNATRVFAVGTTSVKALETAWQQHKIVPGSGWSDIFIKPCYVFKAPVHAMITNFHLPKSSLLMLTCAFGGRQRVLSAYAKALQSGYHVGSLGDAMLLTREE